MISNNIKRRIQQIKLYESQGNQTMLAEQHIRTLLAEINPIDLADPTVTYCDPQCGSGSIMLVLADMLMDALVDAIPDNAARLAHIFTRQIYANDIDSTQARVARSNFKRAVNDKDFPVNVTEQDCFDINAQYSYVISAIDFETTNQFVPKWRRQCGKLIILNRPNKTVYSGRLITEITRYRYIGRTMSVPTCMMVFDPVKANTLVEFTDGATTILVDTPTSLPGPDLVMYAYAQEIRDANLPGYDAHYGPFVSNDPRVVNNPGRTPLIYQVGAKGDDFLKIIKVSSKILTGKEGVGKHKVVISKNGNTGNQSAVKYAGPTYGTGHNALWIETASQAEANRIIEYWETPAVVKLSLALNATNPANGVGFWKQIPKLDNYNKVKAIYDKYYKS
jgi:hypothetical protein